MLWSSSPCSPSRSPLSLGPSPIALRLLVLPPPVLLPGPLSPGLPTLVLPLLMPFPWFSSPGPPSAGPTHRVLRPLFLLSHSSLPWSSSPSPPCPGPPPSVLPALVLLPQSSLPCFSSLVGQSGVSHFGGLGGQYKDKELRDSLHIGEKEPLCQGSPQSEGETWLLP